MAAAAPLVNALTDLNNVITTSVRASRLLIITRTDLPTQAQNYNTAVAAVATEVRALSTPLYSCPNHELFRYRPWSPLLRPTMLLPFKPYTN